MAMVIALVVAIAIAFAEQQHLTKNSESNLNPGPSDSQRAGARAGYIWLTSSIIAAASDVPALLLQIQTVTVTKSL